MQRAISPEQRSPSSAAERSSAATARFADAVAARHDLRVWQLPDGTSYDVMMVWHQSVNGDPAQRWLREQVRHLFGQGRVAANEPVDCASLG